MRQLTVGGSESPHVIHITSKGDILHLLNCFLSARFNFVLRLNRDERRRNNDSFYPILGKFII